MREIEWAWKRGRVPECDSDVCKLLGLSDQRFEDEEVGQPEAGKPQVADFVAAWIVPRLERVGHGE